MVYLFAVALIALTALSLRSVGVLRTRSPWTSLGWAATVGYCAAASFELRGPSHHLAQAVAYGFLAVLIAGFVVAGVRDEPQAEPWYWPAGPGKTRAEKRRV